MKTTDVVAIPDGQKPADMIRLAVDKGTDLSKLRELLEIQKDWEANEARKAYHKAMSDFKANPPTILKDKSVGYESKSGGQKVGYKHATLANVTQKISAELSKHGLSASWRVSQNGVIAVTTRIAHVQGHFEETTVSAPSDKSGSKNDIQAIGSTITYLERYGLLALTGLATFDQDDDAVNAEKIDHKQLNQLLDMVADKGVDIAKFCNYLKVDQLENLPKTKFEQAFEALKAKPTPATKVTK